MLDSFADVVAEKVAARIKAEEADKPRYYMRKDLCEILHVTNPTIIEMVKRGDIKELRIGGRVLYDADAIDKAVREKTIFRYKRNK